MRLAKPFAHFGTQSATRKDQIGAKCKFEIQKYPPLEPIPKDRRGDDAWITSRMIHWEPHSQDGVLQAHWECRRWSKATFVAKLREAKIKVAKGTAVPAVRALWLRYSMGGDVHLS